MTDHETERRDEGAPEGDGVGGGRADTAGGHDEAVPGAEGSEDRTRGAGERGEAWDPWGALSHLHETVGGIVDTALRNVSPGAGRFPRYDLLEVPGEGYRISFDLPGLEKSDVDVSVTGHELTVSGERVRPEDPEGARLQRSERAYGRFRRTLELPAGVDPDRIAARMTNGVLEIRLPLREADEAQKIRVE